MSDLQTLTRAACLVTFALLAPGRAHAAGQHWIGVGARVAPWASGTAADRVRLGVRDEGVYRVTAEEIACASGVPAPSVLDALSHAGLALRCGQRELAWATDGESLFFYGQPTTEAFSPENVYWLSFGEGRVMGLADASPAVGQATNQWFLCEYSARRDFLAPGDYRDRRSSNGTITNVANYGRWIPASATESTRARSATLSLPGFCPTSETGMVARVSAVSYREFSDPDNHVCEVWINGAAAGSAAWSGERAVTFDGAASALAVTNGLAVVKVRNGLTSSAFADFMLLDVRIAYPRAYVAQEGVLFCTGGAAGTASVSGFGSPHIRVLDVTGADSPGELAPAIRQDGDGRWRASFACGNADARYAVFDTGSGFYEPSVSGARDVDWTDAAEMPQLAIVIPPRRWAPGFEAVMQPLADFRMAQGLRTRIIDAEDLYNAFTGGLVHPAAFQAFSRAGVTSARAPLRYILFAGHAGSDYKLEAFPLEKPSCFPNYFPLYLLGVEEPALSAGLIVPNDLVLGNTDGHPAPEVAIGRFIASNAVDLACMVGKTIAYEKTETWKRKAVVTSGYPDGALDFITNAGATAEGLASAGWRVDRYVPASTQLRGLWNGTYYSTNAHDDLKAGAGLFYYLGHSNDTIAGATTSGALLSNSDLIGADWPFAPVALLLGCRMGRWTTLDVRAQVQYSLAESGFHNRASGFTAVLAAAGYMQDLDAFAFSRTFGSKLAGNARLGDVWLAALQAMPESAFPSLQHLSFLGDPALVVSCAQTGLGTSTDWLIAHGLTGDPYADAADPDGDGFANWLEFQAGTDPRANRIQLSSPAMNGAEGTFRFAFTPKAGLEYEVLSATNLTAGTWERSPWRGNSGSAWRNDAVKGSSPLQWLEVPQSAPKHRRFFKIRQKEPGAS